MKKVGFIGACDKANLIMYVAKALTWKKQRVLVIDGTTGQNAISQVKAFKQEADITGLILTKLDGTAKGGVAIGIVNENSIPVKFVGVKEKIESLNEIMER